MTTLSTIPIDPDKIVGDLGSVLSSALVVIGDKMGLYKALASAGPLTPRELAARTRTSETYVRQWLINQAPSGFVEYIPAAGKYSLSPEQAALFASDDTPSLWWVAMS